MCVRECVCLCVHVCLILCVHVCVCMCVYFCVCVCRLDTNVIHGPQCTARVPLIAGALEWTPTLYERIDGCITQLCYWSVCSFITYKPMVLSSSSLVSHGYKMNTCIKWLPRCMNTFSTFTEGGHWGPKWYGFCMLLGYGSYNLQVSSSALIWNAAELETCKLWEPYLIGRGVNPTFWAAVCCIWPASAPNWVMFGVLESLK